MSPLQPLGQHHTSAWGNLEELKPLFALKSLPPFLLRVFKQQDTEDTSRECWPWAVVSSQGQGTGQLCCVPACQRALCLLHVPRWSPARHVLCFIFKYPGLLL